MYQVRIVFTCICAYVPRKDDVLVVLPDGRSGCQPPLTADTTGMGGMDMGSDVPPHVPVIQFDPTDLSPDSDLKPDLLFQDPGARRNEGLIFLTGADIALEPSPTGAPALQGGRLPHSKSPKSPAEAGDFSWIADVASLDARAGVIHPLCAKPGSSAEGRVVARLSLRGGALSVLLLGRDLKTGKTATFDFVDAGDVKSTLPGHTQALASGVAYEVAVSDEEFALVLTPFDGDKSPRRLKFSFAGLVGYTIQIMIKNMPLDGILEMTNVIEPGRSLAEDVNKHFAMYYQLSKTAPVTPWIPYTLPARFGTTICPAAKFSE